MSVKFWCQKMVSILCSMALLWQSLLSVPSFGAEDNPTIAKANFMQAFKSQMSIANPTADDFSSMLNAAKGMQQNLTGNEKALFEQKILTPLSAFNNANKVIDDCSCADGDCSLKNLNLNFDLFQTDDMGQCQRQKSLIDDDFKSFLNSFNAVNLKLVLPSDFKRAGDWQAKQKNLKEFRDLLVAQTQEDLLLPYIKLSRNFRDGKFPGKSKDVLSKLKISLKKEKPTVDLMQKLLDEPIQNDKDNNPALRREKLFVGFQKELKSIHHIYNEEQDFAEAINQRDRVAPSIWSKDKSWISPDASHSELSQQREEVKAIFPSLNYDSKATTVDEIAAPTFQAATFAVESQAQFPKEPGIIKLKIDRVNYQALAAKKSRVDESIIPEYLNVKYGILARGQEKFKGNEETRAVKEKMLAADLKKYFLANLLPQKTELTNDQKNQMAEKFLLNLDENIESSFSAMRDNKAGLTYSITGGASVDYDNNHPYIKSQEAKSNQPKLRILGQSNEQTNNARKLEATLRHNRGLNQEQIIGAGIRAAIENVPMPQGGELNQFLQQKVSANFYARQEISENLKTNPIFYGGENGLASKLYRGDPNAKKEDMQAALDDYFAKTESLLSEIEKNYDQDDPEDQIASILKRNPALVARVLSKNPQYAGMVCDLKKKFLKDQKSSQLWDKIFFGAGMVLMGAAILLTAGAALGAFAVVGAVTAGLGVTGFALGAIGTTRTAMTSAELFEESRQANQYLVSMGVGNKEEVQKLLDEANRKMRDAYVEGAMTLVGGTGLGLSGKLLRYAKGRNPAVVKSMLQEAGSSKEGAKKLARSLDEDSAGTVNTTLNAKKYKTKEMKEDYKGEDLRDGQTGVPVKYLNDAERSAHQIYPKDGKFYDASGKLVCASRSCKGIFVMDEKGQLFFKHDVVEGEFHHSSFLAGKPAAGAGEFEFIDGKLVLLTDKSGHYKPTTAEVKQVIDELNLNGIKLDKEQMDLKFSSNATSNLAKNSDVGQVRRNAETLNGIDPAIESKIASGNFDSLGPQDKVIAVENTLGRKLTDREKEQLISRPDWHESLNTEEYSKLSNKKIIQDDDFSPMTTVPPSSIPNSAASQLTLASAAKLDDSQRVIISSEMINRNLTLPEQKAIIDAHNVGRGEAGKDLTRSAGHNNYTAAQIAEKARILKERGFSDQERRILMEKGLVGNQATPLSSASIENLKLLSFRERDQRMLEIASEQGVPRGQIETVTLQGDEMVVSLKGGETRKLSLVGSVESVPKTKTIAAPTVSGSVRPSRPVNLPKDTDVHVMRDKTMNAISKDYDGAAVVAHGIDQRGIMGVLDSGHLNRAGRLAVSTGDDKVDEGIIYFTSRKYSAAEYATVSAEKANDATLAGGVIILKKDYVSVQGALPHEAANKGVTHTLNDGSLVRAKDDMYIGINPASKGGLPVNAIEKIYVTPNTYNSVYDKYILGEFRKRGGESLAAPAQQAMLKELEAEPIEAFAGRSINQFLRVVE